MLVDLATVKSWLGITGTTYDAQLTTLIAGVDEQIKRYCARNFEVGTVVAKLILAPNDREIVLDETPVAAILYSAGNKQTALEISHPTANCSATVNTTAAGVTTVRLVVGSVATDVAVAVGDTLTDLAAGIVSAGWAADVAPGYGDYPALCLLDQTTGEGEPDETLVLYGALTPLTLIRGDVEGVYRLSLHSSERYWGPDPACGDRPIVVHYTGGYATLPAGLVLIAIKCCCDAWRTFGNAAGMKSESVGDYSYDKGAAAVAVASAIGPYLGALDLYRRV